MKVKDCTLKVTEGESISIIGGDIRIENGHLVAPRGRVNLASLGSQGRVEIVSDGLKVEASNGLGNISISNLEDASDKVNIDVSGEPSGSIDIYCKTVFLNYSEIKSQNFSDINKGGKFRLVADESFFIDNSGIYNDNYGKGAGGDIDIQTICLMLTNGGLISASTFGSGDGGDVTIKAKDVSIDGGFESTSGFKSSMITCQTESTGNAGSITIDTESLTLSNGGLISTTTFSSGDGGDVTINAKEVSIEGSFESSNVVHSSWITCQTESTGNAGSLNIDTESLTLSNGAILSAGTFGSGDGGDVTIKAKDVSIDGGFESSDGVHISRISCQANPGSTGNAGSLNIETDSLTLSNGGLISATTFGSGNGGDVTIKANDVSIDGGFESSDLFYPSKITCQANPGSTGNAGSINIDTASLTLSNGGRISASTFSSGNGGDVTINAKDVSIDKGFESSNGVYYSMIDCQADTDSTGNAGSLNIDTESLTLSNGGQISSSTYGSGDGGDVTIKAKNVSIDGGFESSNGFKPSLISCKAGSNFSGKAGNISLQADTLAMSNSGEISVTTYGKNTGGSIGINVDLLNMNSGAVISSASIGTGDAGNINLTVADKLESRNSTITTESKQADGGDITITNIGFITWLIDSSITATVGGGPQTTGGNIRINSPYVVLKDSHVIANAYEGKGGSIGITADTYIADWISIVSASSSLGISGQVDINSPLVNLSGLLSPLPTAVVDISELLADDCETRYKYRKISSLIVRGRDALPAQPGDLWPSPIMMK